MTVLPNDISWFTSTSDIDLATEESSVVSIVFHKYGLVVKISSALTLFSLKSHEAGDWSLHLIKKLLRVSESSLHFKVKFLIFWPFFFCDEFTSSSKVVDDFSIVESKSDNSYLDRHNIAFGAIDTECGELGQSRLHLIFNIRPKLTDFRYRVRLIKVLFLEVFIHFWMNTELHGIIGSGASLDVPLDI